MLDLGIFAIKEKKRKIVLKTNNTCNFETQNVYLKSTIAKSNIKIIFHYLTSRYIHIKIKPKYRVKRDLKLHLVAKTPFCYVLQKISLIIDFCFVVRNFISKSLYEQTIGFYFTIDIFAALN